MKILINSKYGGFGVSDEAEALYCARTGCEEFDRHLTALRTDPVLITIVEELGKKANGKYSDLEVVEIPDGIEWEIQEYDGFEWVQEKCLKWGRFLG